VFPFGVGCVVSSRDREGLSRSQEYCSSGASTSQRVHKSDGARSSTRRWLFPEYLAQALAEPVSDKFGSASWLRSPFCFVIRANLCAISPTGADADESSVYAGRTSCWQKPHPGQVSWCGILSLWRWGLPRFRNAKNAMSRPYRRRGGECQIAQHIDQRLLREEACAAR
jgi:hypothetical protein